MMKKTIGAVYADSKREWVLKTPEDQKSPLLSLPDRRAIEVLTRHNCFWLGEHYGEHIGPKVSELARQALDSGLGRKAFAKELKRTLGGVAPADYKYWDVAASAALVRARSFGVISGMEDAEITEYEVVAMGDERMCPICGEMNGRTFSVTETRKVIDSVLSIQDPKAFKKALPWQTKPAKGVSDAALCSSGQSIPPFHGRCRCVLVMTGTVSEGAKPPQEDTPVVFNAKTIAEANEQAVKYGIAKNANFKGLDVSVANEMNTGVLRAQRAFPELKGKMDFIGSTQERLTLAHNLTAQNVLIECTDRLHKIYPGKTDEELLEILKKRLKKDRAKANVYATSWPDSPRGTGGITVNANYGSAKRLSKFKASLSNDVKALFHPESCDTVKSIIDHEMGHEIDKLLKAKADPTVRKLYDSLAKSGKMKEELSGYSEKNIGEFIAEAWAEYQNNPKPRATARKVAERLLELKGD
jgi:hypothetical protein